MYRDDISPGSPSGGRGGGSNIDNIIKDLEDIGIYTDIEEFEDAVSKDPIMREQLSTVLGGSSPPSESSSRNGSSDSNGSSSSSGSDYSSGGGGCFIATVVYGENSWQVTVLRRFRDECLLTNTIGRMFVKLYYATSPPIADFLRGKKILCGMVRALLNPICKVVKKITN